jgi:hypothetical protein
MPLWQLALLQMPRYKITSGSKKPLGLDRLCGSTGTVSGPGFLVVRVGQHLARISSFVRNKSLVSRPYALLRTPFSESVANKGPACLPARCAQAGVRYAQAGAIISAIHE